MKKLLLSIGLACTCVLLAAQSSPVSPTDLALDHLQKQSAAWKLEPADISSLRITDMYTSAHNGVTHLYFAQQFKGVDIHGATYNAHVKNGQILIAGERLFKNVATSVVPVSTKITPADAVTRVLGDLGTAVRGPLVVREHVDENRYVFDRGAHALQHIPVRRVYAQSGGKLVLAWEVTVEPAPDGDLWSALVHAGDGSIIAKQLLTVYCSFPDHYLARPHTCNDHSAHMSEESLPHNSAAFDGAGYRVFAIPFESPKHGPHELIPSPFDVDASPLGWHDTNGLPGPEFTHTRGNNAHSFVDRNGDNTPDSQTNGGPDLVFDFDYQNTLEPDQYIDAAVTNLFYMNNIMHDFSWHYGFDELSGNFQQRNATGLGADGDYVIAQAQFGADNANPPLNNATFGTPADGGSGRMRMYLWSQAGANQLLRVDSPAEIAGKYQTTTTSTDWGAPITSTPLTGEVVIVTDGTSSGTMGCNPLINGGDIAGKIALIDRGNCEFGRKALNAQERGAIGFIICNFEEGYVNMGAGAVGGQVNIPGVFISYSDCQKIRVFAGSGLVVSLVNEATGTGPAMRDASLDNGVIAHEYGHGISTRLTGGPSNSGCLININEDGEQMGEGWSDFFSLVTTVRPGDTKDVPRGVGTYSAGQETTGVGIRSYAYSPNMNINPITYDDVAFLSVPHGIGTVWCTVLWDLYWRLADEYGYDDDLYRGTGGNNLAIQLVMDGMKLQVCNPGLLDGRDAILAADRALTGGANQKLIWEVFARRGMGYSAQQGEARFRHDNSEAFDIYPLVIKELKVVKHMTPYIERGDAIDVTLLAVNHKEIDAPGVVVHDALPSGTTLVPGSASHPFTLQGDELNFEIGNLASGDTTRITYRLSSDPSLFSERYFYDDVEGDFLWDATIEDWPILQWEPQNLITHSGDVAWLVNNIDTAIDQSLMMLEPIRLPANNPALMFYHYYSTERFFDAGIVQVSDDGGLSWDTPGPDKIIRGDYSGKVLFSLFAVPRIKAWHGESNGWVHTVVDLSEYAGKEVFVRFRFASDGNTGGLGWFIDDIELVELFNYNAEVCISSTDGDIGCAIAERAGTIVASDITSSISDTERPRSFAMNVFPNPANNRFMVDIVSETAQRAELSVANASGQIIWSQQLVLPAGKFREHINAQILPEGFYIVRIQGERDMEVRKVIVQR